MNNQLDHQTQTLEALQADTQSQISALNQQSQSLTQYTQDVADLIRRYNAKKSFLGHATHWYGEQAWWMKLIISVVLTGFGMLCHLSFISSCFLSLALSFLAIDHHTVSKERNEIIAEELKDQNDSLESSLGHLQTTRTKLERITNTLCAMNAQMSKIHARLEEDIRVTQDQLSQSRNAVMALQGQMDSFQQTQTELEKRLSEATKHLESYQLIVESGAKSLLATDRNLSATAQSASKDATNLRGINDRMSKALKELEAHTKIVKKFTGAGEHLDLDNASEALGASTYCVVNLPPLDTIRQENNELGQQVAARLTPQKDVQSNRKLASGSSPSPSFS